jgi:hypothetical protein
VGTPALWRQEFSHMTDDPVRPDGAFLDEVRRSRGALEEQIKQSQRTIEKSRELLKRMDEIISNADKKK